MHECAQFAVVHACVRKDVVDEFVLPYDNVCFMHRAHQQRKLPNTTFVGSKLPNTTFVGSKLIRRKCSDYRATAQRKVLGFFQDGRSEIVIGNLVQACKACFQAAGIWCKPVRLAYKQREFGASL